MQFSNYFQSKQLISDVNSLIAITIKCLIEMKKYCRPIFPIIITHK